MSQDQHPVQLTPDQEYDLRFYANREVSGTAQMREERPEWDSGLLFSYVDRNLDKLTLGKTFVMGQTFLWNSPANPRYEPYVVKISKIPKEVFTQLINRYLGVKLYGGGGNAGEGFIKVPMWDDKVHFTDGTRLFVGQCPAIQAQRGPNESGAAKPAGFAPRPTMRTDHELTVKMFVLLLYFIEFEMPSIYGPRHYVPLCDLLFQGLCTCRPWIRDYDKWWMIKTFNHCFTLSKSLGKERELRIHPAKPDDMVLFKDENLILTFESQHGKQEREATRRKGIEERIENLSKQVYAGYFDRLGPSFSNPDDTSLLKILAENEEEESKPPKGPNPDAPNSAYTVASLDPLKMTLSSGYGMISPDKLPAPLKQVTSELISYLRNLSSPLFSFKEEEKRAKGLSADVLFHQNQKFLPDVGLSLHRLHHEADWIVSPLIDEYVEHSMFVTEDFELVSQCRRPVDTLAQSLIITSPMKIPTSDSPLSRVGLQNPELPLVADGILLPFDDLTQKAASTDPGGGTNDSSSRAGIRTTLQKKAKGPDFPLDTQEGTGSSKSSPHEILTDVFSTPLNKPKIFFKPLPCFGDKFDVKSLLFQVASDLSHNYHSKGKIHGNLGLHCIAVAYPPYTTSARISAARDVSSARFRLIPSLETEFSFRQEPEERVRTAAIAHDIGDFCFMALQLLYPEIALYVHLEAKNKLKVVAKDIEQLKANRRTQAAHSVEILKQILSLIYEERSLGSWEEEKAAPSSQIMGYCLVKNLIATVDAICLCAASRSTEPRVKVTASAFYKIEGLIHLGQVLQFFDPKEVKSVVGGYEESKSTRGELEIFTSEMHSELSRSSSINRKRCRELIRAVLHRIWNKEEVKGTLVGDHHPLAMLPPERLFETPASLSSFYSVNSLAAVTPADRRLLSVLLDFYDEHCQPEGYHTSGIEIYETSDREMCFDFDQFQRSIGMKFAHGR